MYAFSFVLLAIVYMGLKTKKSLNITRSIYDKKHLLIYFAMAFFLYTNSVTKTTAATFLSSAQIYPVLQGANLILSAIMTHVLFKEKINVKGLAGIVIAFIGLLLIYI
jgi:drug/metabolite transporter (DMT)-like permease